MYRWEIGIDEVGRGPLAGPVAVGAACVPRDFDWMLLPGVTDSKKLTEARREEIYSIATNLRRSGAITWSVAMVGPQVIDTKGIVPAINLALKRSLTRTINTIIYDSVRERVVEQVLVKLDGGLRAPDIYPHQETIIKGDAKEQVIGLASIVAKVTRDRYMERVAAEPAFAPYMLAVHKGYGTKAHRAAIAEHGPSAIHRQSFCRNIVRSR